LRSRNLLNNIKEKELKIEKKEIVDEKSKVKAVSEDGDAI